MLLVEFWIDQNCRISDSCWLHDRDFGGGGEKRG